MKTLETEIHKFNFPRILIDLHRNRRTGTLVVNSGDVTKKVYIENGNAIFASSTDEDDRLGEMLIKLGKITYEQYEKSVELLKETGKRQGTILAELGYLSPKDLVLGVKAQVREIIYSLFQLEYAEYVFEEGTIPTREVITLQMSIGNLIYEGMKRISNVVRIRRDMPDMDTVLKVNEEQNSFCQDIVLTPGDSAMLAMVDGKKTVKELIDGTSSSTFEAMKTLYILYVAGFVIEESACQDATKGMESDDVNVSAVEEYDTVFREQVNALFSRLHDMQAHEILSIDEHSDSETVERQYYKLIADYHPDRGITGGDPLMQDKLIAITERIQDAYMTLKDKDTRKRYFEAIGNQNDVSSQMSSGEDDVMSELYKINEDMRMIHGDSRDLEGLEGEKNDYINGLPFREPEPSVNFFSFEESIDGFTRKQDGETVLHRDDEAEPCESDRLKSLADEESSASDQRMFWEAESAGSPEMSEREVLSSELPVQEKMETIAERSPEMGPMDGMSTDSEGNDAAVSEAERAVSDGAQSENELQQQITERRRFKRFKVDGCHVSGELLHARTVTIVDVSVSGVALKVDRQVRVGGRYSLTLRDKDRNIRLSAEVVRSNLVESKIDSEGNAIPQYLVGMEFKDLSPETMREVTEFLNHHKVADVAVNTEGTLSGTRVHARYALESTDETSLDLKRSCKVKVLSLCGMLIESTQAVQPNDTVSVLLSLPEGRKISLTGKTVSSKISEVNPDSYDIAIEFVEMSDEDREDLKMFLESVSELEQSRPASLETTRADETFAGESRDAGERSEKHANSEVPRIGSEKKAYRSEPAHFNQELLTLVGEIKSVLEQIRDEFRLQTCSRVQESVIVEKTIEDTVSTHFNSPRGEEVWSLPEAGGGSREEKPNEPLGVHPESVETSGADHSQRNHGEKEKVVAQKFGRRKKKLRRAYVLIPLLFLIAGIASFMLVYTPSKSDMPLKAQVKKVSPVSMPETATQPMPNPVTDKKEPVLVPAQSALHTLELRASDTTWLSVTLDGKPSKEMLLKAGDRTQLSAKNTVSLVIGNAAGVRVIFDGKEVPLPTERGKVVKLSLPRGTS